MRSLRYYCGVINLAKRLRKRVVVYGQSVGPLTPTGARLVARTLRGVAVAVRDRPSQARLADLGVPAALVADAALALPRPLARPAAGTTEAPVLLVPRGGFPEVTAALVALARRLEAEGVALAGLALQPGEDARPLEGLARAVPALRPLAATTPEGALAHVAGSRYVVSARLHGLVFAALAERPASGVAYDPKVLAFGAEAGFPVHPLAADPEALRADVFHPRFRRLKVDALVARAQNGLAWLRRELER